MPMVKECKRFNGSILFLAFSLVICFSCHSSKKMNENNTTTNDMISEIWNPLIVLTQKEKKIEGVKIKKELLRINPNSKTILFVKMQYLVIIIMVLI